MIILYVLTLAKASFVSALRETAVVFGVLFGVVLLKEALNLGMVSGIVSVIVGLVLIKIE